MLRHLGLQESADRLAHPDDALIAAYRSQLDAARAEMTRFDVSGVPALIVGTGEKRHMMQASALFGGLETFFARLKAA
ncbi:hypothetical protein BH10PSE8_BH10PSE8_09490 [soil metagenome]